jgi:tripartite-type tricarboxylate transporter receptor subunit TctC
MEEMAMRRRELLARSGGALLASPARAAEWPDRPIRMIMPFGPGSSADVLGRLLAEPLSQRLGQPIVCENRTGAAGSIAAEAVARMAADGHALLLAIIGTQSVNRHLYARLPDDPERDFTPIWHLWNSVNVMAVSADKPWTNVQALITAGQKRGRLTFGSPGNGTSDHMTSSLFGIRTGLNLEHVPYRGGSAAVQLDLIANRLDYTIGNVPALMGGIRGGRLRPLAVVYMPSAGRRCPRCRQWKRPASRTWWCRPGTRWSCRAACRMRSRTGWRWRRSAW